MMGSVRPLGPPIILKQTGRGKSAQDDLPVRECAMSFNKFRYRLGAIGASLSGLWRDSRGNVAITFAFAAVPVIMAVGAAAFTRGCSRAKGVRASVAGAGLLSAPNRAAMPSAPKNAKTRAVAS